MTRELVACLAVLTLSLSAVSAQSLEPTTAGDGKGTYLGILFSPVPDALYDQLPNLPRGEGVLVTYVVPESPAARPGGIRRNDVLLQYDDERIRDGEQLARLIHDDKPKRHVKLLVMRGGREQTAEIVLGEGLVLRVARASSDVDRAKVEVPRALAKPAGPGSVNVSAKLLNDGSLKVTIDYFEEGKPQSLICTGKQSDIEKQILKLPPRTQQLARCGLERVRILLPQSDSDKPEAPASKGS